MLRSRLLLLLVLNLTLLVSTVQADAPDAKYIFPAGGQRGTTVPVSIGGCNFHDRARFHLMGSGIHATSEIVRANTKWFEGPLIPLPASQQQEDYPLDHANSFEIAADAPLGDHFWKVSTSQGVTGTLPFVVGEFPEVVEQELPGRTHPVDVSLPVTVNGRIFPREDVDQWRFHADAGQTITCAVDASRLRSPLAARLELFDPKGQSLDESLSQAGQDAMLRFTAAATGEYSIKIHDIQFGGLQHYVYRLTITAGPHVDSVYPLGARRGTEVALQLTGANLPEAISSVKVPLVAEAQWDYRVEQNANSRSNSIALEVDDVPEFVESPVTDKHPAVSFPAVLNGRIERPGEVDVWTFSGRKGEEIDFDLRAARLGSSLDSVLQVLDAQQKVLSENDDLANGQTDSRLRVSIPADGEYAVRIADRLPGRGGPRFSYRLRVTVAAQPDFQLTLSTDSLTLERGKPATLKVMVDRGPGVTEEIALQMTGLPGGIAVSPTVIAAQQNVATLSFQAAETQKIECLPITITGKVVHGGQEIVRPALFGNRSGGGQPTPVWLAVALQAPFRFAGLFETKYMPRGSRYVRHYTIQRNGFEGPLDARLADQQGRHLQGVTGDPVAISPSQDHFDFTVNLPSWMEIGRTSRTTLSLHGVLTDFDGSRHVVSYSSNAQNDQMIALIDPGKMALTLDRRTLAVAPVGRVKFGFRLQRSAGLNEPSHIEIVVPDGVHGVSAEPLTLPAKSEQGELELRFSDQTADPFLAPLVIRATTLDERRLPVVSDTQLELVRTTAKTLTP